MWWTLAAAAAPYVLAAMQDKPKAPAAPTYRTPTNRDLYINSLLSAANNPQSQTYQLASAQTAEAVNRALARQGLAGSSIGAQLHNMTQTDLAQKWLQNEMQRKQQALQTAMQYDNAQAGAFNNNADAMYKYQMDAYNRAVGNNAAQVQNIAGLANAGLQMYNQNQVLNRLDAMNANQTPTYVPIYGTPGQQAPQVSWNAAPVVQPNYAALPAYDPSNIYGLPNGGR